MDRPLPPFLGATPLRPMQPTANPGGVAPVLHPSATSANVGRKSVFGKLDINKIGQGRLLTEGSYDRAIGLKKDIGLKGQLMSMRRAGRRSTTKNLSLENVKQIHDLIADPIKNNALSSSSYISRGDRLKIMKESRRMVKDENTKFTRADRQDLLKIVDTLRRQYKENLLNRDRDNN